MSTKLGCIADDYTGATDLSSMLVRHGLRVVQLFGNPSKEKLDSTEFRERIAIADAVVIALKSRSIPAKEAVTLSLAALAKLFEFGANRFYFKYCSTFDSTEMGNIGPVAEAIATRLGVNDVWYCPAFPENGRTLYNGHLFVGNLPLHESGMKDHPLNPMRDSNLVRVLQAQCRHSVHLLSRDRLHARELPIQRNTIQHWIVDSIDNLELQLVAQLAQDKLFMTGGSAMGGYWASSFVDDLSNGISSIAKNRSSSETDWTIIFAGSCSSATRGQVVEFETLGGSVLRVEAVELHPDSNSMQQSVLKASNWCMQQMAYGAAIVTTSWDLSTVAKTTSTLGVERSAKLVEAFFGSLAKSLYDRGLRRFVVAGGETSGAVMNAIGIEGVEIGREIAPGVPWVHSIERPECALALKSGNFGTKSFFCDAIQPAKESFR